MSTQFAETNSLKVDLCQDLSTLCQETDGAWAHWVGLWEKASAFLCWAPVWCWTWNKKSYNEKNHQITLALVSFAFNVLGQDSPQFCFWCDSLHKEGETSEGLFEFWNSLSIVLSIAPSPAGHFLWDMGRWGDYSREVSHELAISQPKKGTYQFLSGRMQVLLNNLHLLWFEYPPDIW